MNKNTYVPKLLTMADAAERLECSTKTVQRAISDGDLRAHRIRKRLVRIAEDDLIAFMSRSRR